MTYHVYIMASRPNGTTYIGVTNNLARRAHEHRQGQQAGFTKRYAVKRLVYAEPYEDIEEALVREKRLKKWNREWKIKLIESANPEWRDLWDDLNN